MGGRRVGFWLILLGIVGIAGAGVWWMSFYSKVMQFLGKNGPPPTECLYQLTGPCRAVSNMASLAGAGSYEPILFWASLAAIVVGLILWIKGAIGNIAGHILQRSRPDQTRRT